MKFTVFGRPGCGYCDKAVDLLSSRGEDFKYINIYDEPAAKAWIVSQGHTLVPQIYYEKDNEQHHIGGFVDLVTFFDQKEEEAVEPVEEQEVEYPIPDPIPGVEEKILDKFPIPETCHYCGGNVRLVNNAEIYNGKSYGEWPLAYLCDCCRAYVSVHKGTHIPMGTLADEPTRKARVEAKNSFNPLWINQGMRRSEAYQWLADKMGIPKEQCHIGLFNVEQCKQVIQFSEEEKRK